MNLTRLIPVLIMVGGLTVGIRHGSALYGEVVQKVEILVTGMELSRIAREVRFHHATFGTVPPMANPEEFAEFLRDSLTPYLIERDVALDFWDEPYRLEHDEEDLVVLSTGPDRERTYCAHGHKDAELPPLSEGEPPPDDICASIRLERQTPSP